MDIRISLTAMKSLLLKIAINSVLLLLVISALKDFTWILMVLIVILIHSLQKPVVYFTKMPLWRCVLSVNKITSYPTMNVLLLYKGLLRIVSIIQDLKGSQFTVRFVMGRDSTMGMFVLTMLIIQIVPLSIQLLISVLLVLAVHCL